MPRPGVSFDEVAAVADCMVSEGFCPTIRNVREQLGTGSETTVHKHLTAWRNSLPQLAAVTIELPVNILSSISQEIVRAKSEARAEIETRLVTAQADMAELASNGEALEDELAKCLEALRVMTIDRDMLFGNNGGQEQEIERLRGENERERYSADQAQIEVAQLRNKLVTMEENQAKQSAAIDRLTSAHATESQARINAEKDAAVLAARFEAEQDKSRALQSEKETLTIQIGTERQAAESTRMEATKATSELASQAAVLAQKVSDIMELSAACEAEKNARLATEKSIEVLQERLVVDRKSLESTRAEAAIKADEFASQTAAQVQKVSEITELSESLETEKNARFNADEKIAVFDSRLEKEKLLIAHSN